MLRRTFRRVRSRLSTRLANTILEHKALNSLPAAAWRESNRVASVLLPSRQRVEHLEKSVDSLLQHAANPDSVEILIRLDNDDPQLDAAFYMLQGKRAEDHHIAILIGERYRGYRDMHIYVNELCQIARGDFLFLFNDDALMTTPDWDRAMVPYRNQLCCLRVTENNTPHAEIHVFGFPAIHRRIYDIIGHFSLLGFNDRWIHDLSNTANIAHNIPVNIRHPIANQENDVTVQQSSSSYYAIKNEYLKMVNTVMMQEDCRKLEDYITRKGVLLTHENGKTNRR